MKTTITTPTVASPPPASPARPPRRHLILPGTQYLGRQLAQHGARKFVLGVTLLILIAVGALGATVWFALPSVLGWIDALGSYQPQVKAWTGHIGAPGEDRAHQTTVIASYAETAPLWIAVIPPDTSKLVEASAPPQPAAHPRILDLAWNAKSSELTVTVDPDWKRLLTSKMQVVFSYKGGKLRFVTVGQGG